MTGQKLLFVVPICFPLNVLHVNLWMSDHYTVINGYMTIMDVMYDMSQFVVVVPIPNKYCAILANHFMQHILIKFSLITLLF